MSQSSMNPIDVGAGKLIPQGNLSNHPASYQGMRDALDKAQKNTITSGSTAYPGFKPGFTIKGLEGDWQSMTKSK